MAAIKQEGIEQGIEKEKIEIAKNLKSMNMNIDSIASATGLSIEQIKKL
jgi:predicted transposase/invertase (TIGR01784 family)